MLLSSAVQNYISDLGELFSPTVESRMFYEQQIATAAQTLLGDGVIGFVGMGYPFYAFKDKDGLIPVREISRYLEEIKTKAKLCDSDNIDLSDYEIGYSDRAIHGIPGLTESDLVRALPDLDLAVVVTHIDETTVPKLQQKLSEADLYGSDQTLGALFCRTQLLRNQLHSNGENRSALPVDCSIWLRDDLLQALESIRKGRILTKLPYRNFKDQWREPIMGHCLLAADLLFSATPIVGHTEALIHYEILQTQRYLSNLFQGGRFDFLTAALKLRKDRVGRTLRDPQILANLRGRMSNFSNPEWTYNN